MIKPPIIRYLFPILLISLVGCAKTSPPEMSSLSDAHSELIRLCHEEYGLNTVVKAFDNTVWVYLPSEEHFLELKATAQGPQASDQPAMKPTIKFIDTWFEGQGFHLKYDIEASKGYPKDYGYTSTFSEEFQTNQRNILGAIYRAFVNAEKIPDFFVIIMADIVNGLESTTLLYFGDLKRANVDQSFYGEYVKRIISNQPVGDEKIIGDKEGAHIAFKDITWPEFLAQQMLYRINFKYQRSSFPPSNDTRKELLAIAADTTAVYDFTDFTSVNLYDLSDHTTYSLTREDLTAYKSEPSEGRLIHLQFR